MRTVLSVLCILVTACSLSLAGKKKTEEPKVIPEPTPDKALVFLCPVLGSGTVFLDETVFVPFMFRGTCTFDYVDPGTHYMWHGKSRFVEPLALSVIEWDFEAGQTYYFTIAFGLTMTWGNKEIAMFQVLPEEAGQRRIEAAERFETEKNPKHEKFLQRMLKHYDPDGANNALIASRRFDQGAAKRQSADYEAAARLFGDAADKFDELATITKKRKGNAIWGNYLAPLAASASATQQAKIYGTGVALYTLNETGSFEELVAEYERFAAEARSEESECRRRLACLAASEDDAAVDHCIGNETANPEGGRP